MSKFYNMISLYNKKGNAILAYLCNDIENTKDYKIVNGKCYYKGKFIGDIKGDKIYIENGTIHADIRLKPVMPLQFIDMNFIIDKEGMEFKE